MALNEQSGDMYPFITHTWNPIKGKCSHDCVYCYMKRFKQRPLRLDVRDLGTSLGKDNFIFVGSSTDMWAEDVPNVWILDVLEVCMEYPENRYLFQSKNPEGFFGAYRTQRLDELDCILGTTIESNRDLFPSAISEAPWPYARAKQMAKLLSRGFKTMVTIEPIIDFDLKGLVELVKECSPEWINIGADSKGHRLPEPSDVKVMALIAALKHEGFDVKEKDNLKRLFS